MWSNGAATPQFNFGGAPSPFLPYGNSLILNEIHTHFPALLYDNTRFRSLPDVFNYINLRLHQRFDTFTSMGQAYHDSEHRRVLETPVRGGRAAQRYRQPRPTSTQEPLSASIQLDSQGLSSLLAAALLSDFRVPTNFAEPVLIIPSLRQIQAGSTEYNATQESPCAICQDNISVGETIRKIIRCNHSFHKTCIDTWFQRNVHCPVCRNDIRNTWSASGLEATAPSAP